MCWKKSDTLNHFIIDIFLCDDNTDLYMMIFFSETERRMLFEET